MYSIFLVTEKKTQNKTLEVFEDEKQILQQFSPREYFIELLEKVPDIPSVQPRVDMYRKTYRIQDTTKQKIYSIKKKPGKSGPRNPYNLSEEERERRRLSFSGENHPNVRNGFSDEHREKLRQAKLGKPSNFTGRSHTMEYKQKMSEIMKGNKHRVGWIYIYNPLTGEVRNIKETDKLPDGFRYGKGKEIVENLYKEED